jgi:hypothetical protein
MRKEERILRIEFWTTFVYYSKNKQAHFKFTSSYNSVLRRDRPKFLASYLLIMY